MTMACCLNGICLYPEGKWHGTVGGYTNHKCKCAKCLAKWAEYNRPIKRAWRERKRKERIANSV